VENSRPVAAVAREPGVHDTTLGNWVRAYKAKYAGDAAPLELDERARLREAERELRELRQKVAFLEKVAAYVVLLPRVLARVVVGAHGPTATWPVSGGGSSRSIHGSLPTRWPTRLEHRRWVPAQRATRWAI